MFGNGETARKALGMAETNRVKMEAIEAVANDTKAWAQSHESTCTERHKTINGKIDSLLGYQRWQNTGLIAILLTILGAVAYSVVIPHIHFVP